MSGNVYVLMAQGWDYNDEYYFRSEGGNPELVFEDAEKANEARDKSNLGEFKRLHKEGLLREYSSDGLRGLLSESATEEETLYEEGIFMTMFGLSAEDWYEAQWNNKLDDSLKIEPTDEQWKRLFDCFDLNFYDVVRVEKA